MQRLKLYHYWRSSSSWRVRWGFDLKKIACDFEVVDLVGDEAESETHRARNPMGQIPVLEFLDKPPNDPFRYMTESLAILDWAEREVPNPKLWPEDPWLRARAIELAELVNAGIQPIQNPSVSLHHAPDSQDARDAWNRHWIARGLRAFEEKVKDTQGRFCIGDHVSVADLCLIPQVYNAVRFEVSLEFLPRVSAIYNNALQTPECLRSAPDQHKPKS